MLSNIPPLNLRNNKASRRLQNEITELKENIAMGIFPNEMKKNLKTEATNEDLR